MAAEYNTPSSMLAAGAALFALLCAPAATGAQSATRAGHTSAVEVQFRGCDSAGGCRFWIEASAPAAQALVGVWPDGIARIPAGDPSAAALRDRLNALLSNMIHQAKRIVLHDLRRLDDGTFAATVTVNGADLASDPLVEELDRHSHASNR